MSEPKILGADGKPVEYIERDKKEHLLEFFAYETIGCADINIGELDRRLKGKEDADYYRGGNGKRLEHCGCEGVTSIEVLEFLKGMPFDNLIVAWLYALHPSTIRVSYGEVCCDSFRDRVTVWLKEDDTVEKITQEVTVGYGSGYNIEQITQARKRGVEPKPAPSVIGNTAGLERVDFS